MDRLTPQYALAQLTQTGDEKFATLFRHGSMEVEIYKPARIDHQKPHTRDEIYVVISGSGYFQKGTARHAFQPGEVLFVPAGTAHRFEQFTDDFST